MRSTHSERQQLGALGYVRQKRSGVWLYERRIPKQVQSDPRAYSLFDSKPLFRRSLRTKLQSEAFAPANEAHSDFEERLARALGKPEHVKKSLPRQLLRMVTQSDIEDVVQRYRELTRSPFEKAQLLADVDDQAREELERLHYTLEMDAEEIRSIVRDRKKPSENSPYESPADTARWIVEHYKFDAPEGSAAFGAIANAVRAGLEQGLRDVDALHEGKAVPRLPAEAPEKAKALTIRETVERYLSHRKFPQKTVSEVNLTLTAFESTIGNRSLESLIKADFQKFVQSLAEQMVGGKSAGSVKRPMSEQTVQKRLGFLRSAINHAIDRGWFVDRINPASGIKVSAYITKPDPAIMPSKRGFKVGELNRLFMYPWFAGCKSASETHVSGSHRLNGAEYWVPLVALFSGCRASELGGLAISEVHIDDLHPHLSIRDNQYRRTKGGYARDVPILDALIELGFKDYYARVCASGAERLFPDWLCPKQTGDFNRDDAAWSNAKLIRSFNRTVVPKALEGTFVPGARLPVTFHSFRGAFKAMLNSPRYNLGRNVINEIVGHKKDELDERYVGTLPIETTYPAVRACRFDGLLLPR